MANSVMAYADTGQMGDCSVDGCLKPRRGKGYCSAHYTRWLRHGDPLLGGPVRVVTREVDACKVDSCDGMATGALGMCPAHYQRTRIYGDPDVFGPLVRYQKRTADGVCSIQGCEKPYYGKGWCSTHYMRWTRNGDPLKSNLDRENDGACQIEGCEKPYDARGLCGIHFKQLRYREAPRIALDAAHRRRTKLRTGVSFTITAKDHARLSRMPCLACGAQDRLQTEHLVPIDRGGSHGIGNLAMLCHSCNSSKRNQTWMEWRTSGKPRALMLFGRC